MSENPERIWLEPVRDQYADEGRLWCADDVWADDEDGPGVEYALQVRSPRRLCEHHPGVDYTRAWACPDCLQELRLERAAGPVMPETPSEETVSSLGRRYMLERRDVRDILADYRAALAEGQKA